MTTSVIVNYIFNKAAKTVTFTDFPAIELNRVLSITDMTNGVQIYSCRTPQYTGTVDGNILNIKYDTNNPNFNDSDKLYIEYITDNYSQLLIPSSTIPSTGDWQYSDDFTNYGYKGASFMINISAVSGTGPAMDIKIQAKDETSGNWWDIPGAIIGEWGSIQLWRLTIYPGISPISNTNINDVLPRTYRVAYNVYGTEPTITFSVTANYIN